jgi:hypothetical protein
MVKNILFVLGMVSICFNIMTAVIVLNTNNKIQSSIFFTNPATIENTPYLSATAIASVPTSSGDNSVEFGTITIKLSVNESAYLQFNVMFNTGSREAKTTMQNNYLYDRSIVRVENDKITALKKGSTFLQIATNDGIKDVCYIMIKGKEE